MAEFWSRISLIQPQFSKKSLKMRWFRLPPLPLSFQNSSPYGVMPKIAVRGVSHEFNSSILFLLNGKRLNDSMFGSGTALMSYFDLRIVKRVEVIRGAGTLRFGDKAYIGLVNLITNTDQTNASVDLRAPLGSF
jgi:outer membrane cobalamin receptor